MPIIDVSDKKNKLNARNNRCTVHILAIFRIVVLSPRPKNWQILDTNLAYGVYHNDMNPCLQITGRWCSRKAEWVARRTYGGPLEFFSTWGHFIWSRWEILKLKRSIIWKMPVFGNSLETKALEAFFRKSYNGNPDGSKRQPDY